MTFENHLMEFAVLTSDLKKTHGIISIDSEKSLDGI